MGVRRESVDLSLTGSFERDVISAAAAVALLHGRINGLNGQNIRIDTRINNQLASIQRQAGQTDRSINQLTGRLGAWADAALILGPGLVPITAVGTAGVLGLVNAVGSLAIVGAAAVAAFQGLGDAAKAIDEYQLEPTAENLEKAEQAMAKLAPEAQDFLLALQQFQPVLTGIRDAAAEGLFPGLTESLDDFERLAPLVERIFRKSGDAAGDIAADTADALDSKRWRPFMRFIGNEAPETMRDLAVILGDLTHGVAEMWMSLEPGNDATLDWIADVADGFDRWASSAEGRDDIEGFLAYARENGPEVQAFFVALVGALSAIVQAAAPLGGPVLTILTGLLNVFAAIAGSDMGTPILAAAAALRLFNRAAALTQGAAIQNAIAPFRAQASTPPAVNTTNLPPHLRAAAAAPHPSVVAAQQRAAQRAQVARGAGMAAGIGFLATGAASELEMTNTATMALVGSWAGPFGAAAGVAAGALMDVSAANDAAVASLDAVQQAIDRNDFAAIPAGLAAARGEIKALGEDYSSVSSLSDPLATFRTGFGALQGVLGDSPTESAAKEYDALEQKARLAQSSVAGLGEAFGMTVGPIDGSAASLEELQRILRLAKPAMDELRITEQDLKSAFGQQERIGEGGLVGLAHEALAGSATPFDDLTAKLREEAVFAESAAGKTADLTEALLALRTASVPASEQSSMLSDALDAIIDPAMSAEAATDAWRVSLQGLRKDLDASAGFTGYSEASVANRAMTREYVDGVKQRLVAMVAAGASEREVTRATRQARAEFIASGRAAGLSGAQIRRRANAMGLTPKLVRTVFEAVGLVNSTIKAEETRRIYNSLPARVQTKVALDGVPRTRAEAREIADDLNLTARERRALIRLADLASGPARKTGRELDNTARPRTAPIRVVESGSDAAQARINSIEGKTVYVRTVHVDAYATAGGSQKRGAQAGATGGTWTGRGFSARSGGTVPGPLHPYGDKVYAFLAPGEEVTSNEYGQADRDRDLLKAINSNDQERRREELRKAMRADLFSEGGTAGFADRRAARYAVAGSRRSAAAVPGAVVLNLQEMRLRGTVDTPWGPAELKNMMVETARAEIDADRQFEGAHG